MSQHTRQTSHERLAARLATLVHTGVQCFQRICEGELNFSLWRKMVKEHLGSSGQVEYRSLWSIRDEMIQQTWRCPSPGRRPSGAIDASADLPDMER